MNIEIKKAQRQHYDRLFREYEEKSRRSAYMNLIRARYTFNRWASRLRGKCVLDLGCGHGDSALRLAAEGAFVIGLDISMQFVRRSRERIETYEKAGWVQDDAERLPFANETLDAVVSFGTLHHLPHPEQAVLEISRVLRPGGWLFAVEPNATPYRNSLDFYAPLIPAGLQCRLRWQRIQRRSDVSEAERSEFHVGIRTPAQYRNSFGQVGMQADVTTLMFPLFPFTFLGLYEHTLTWQIVAWVSRMLAALIPSLREKGQVQIIEAHKT